MPRHIDQVNLNQMIELIHCFVWLAEEPKFLDEEVTYTVDVSDTKSTKENGEIKMDDADTVKLNGGTARENGEIETARFVYLRFLYGVGSSVQGCA